MNSLKERLVVAIIPARGGSKGLPGKNLRLLAGKPLLWHTVECARQSKEVDRVVVSTEDDQIADFAASLNVEVFRHPEALSSDDSSTVGVIVWDMEQFKHSGLEPELCAVLRATTPLRLPVDIDNCIQLLRENKYADSVVSVVEAVGIHPIRLKRILGDGRLVDGFEPEGNSPKRRQELETLYLRNGGIYAAKPEVIASGGLWGSHCLAYVMPEDRSVNINTEYDFSVAELLLRQRQQEATGG